MTKLYNFQAIWSWKDGFERLHGGTIDFHDDFHEKLRLNLHKDVPWEDACFRCLHLCFLPRSHKDTISNRLNPPELLHGGWRLRLRQKLFRARPSAWKTEKYQRGEVVQKDIASFFMSDASRA